MEANPGQENEQWLDAKLISLDPLVTLSSIEAGRLGAMELADDLPDIFDRQQGLHLLSPTWAIDHGYAGLIADDINRLSSRFPRHRFVVLAGNEAEQFDLRSHGVDAMVLNTSALVDERIWQVLEPSLENFGTYNAVYNARLMFYKRHFLAAKIPSLLLLHRHSFGVDAEQETSQVRATVPHAVSANERLHQGDYVELSPGNAAIAMAHSRCGLALSAIEGTMKASVEYMLCGLPVVSTAAGGSRSRYYCNPFTRIVGDDPDEVAAAVAHLIEQDFDRHAIRNQVSRLIAFDRHNAMLSINKIIEHGMGSGFRMKSIAPMIAFKQHFSRKARVIERLRQQAADLSGLVDGAKSQ